MMQQSEKQGIDSVTLSVIRSSFRAIANEGGIVCERSSFTPIIAESHDASTGVLTADARLISHGYRDMMPHTGTFEAKVSAVLEDYEGDIKQGDIFIINDPYRGGTHHNDVATIKPIFIENELYAFALQLTHWLDAGGPVPGTFNTQAQDMFQEGLIIPPTRFFVNESPVKSFFKLLERNIRVYEETQGDIMAAVQSVRHIESRVKSLVKNYGKATVLQAVEEHFRLSENFVRGEIEKMPDGVYEFEDYGDADPLNVKGPPIKVRCVMTKKGNEVSFDWSESDPAPKGSWGFPRAGLLSANYAGTMFYFPQIAPLNHGVIKCLEIKSKSGTCVDVQAPTPITGYCSGAYEKVEAVTMGCWAEAFAQTEPERVVAGHVNLANLIIGGINPDDGRMTVTYYGLEGGHGASMNKDGANFLKYLYAGTAKRSEAEIIERWNPVLFTNCDAIQDSCGDGKHRGGLGLYRNFKVLGNIVTSIHGDREKFGPYGMCGGSNGGPSRFVLNEGTSKEINLGMFTAGLSLQAGDHITHASNGGGGFGDSLERDPKLVLEDVIDEYISVEKARDVYGVVINVVEKDALDYNIDLKKTEEVRTRLKKSRKLKIGHGPWEVHPLGSKIRIS